MTALLRFIYLLSKCCYLHEAYLTNDSFLFFITVEHFLSGDPIIFANFNGYFKGRFVTGTGSKQTIEISRESVGIFNSTTKEESSVQIKPQKQQDRFLFL